MRSAGRKRIVAAAVASLAVLAVASGAWALIDGGVTPATFRIEIDGETITSAKGYELRGDLVNPGPKQYREYTLTLTMVLKDNPGAAQAFQAGQTFGSVQVDLLASNLAILRTYALTGATVSAYRQTGDAATNVFEHQLVLKSRTLSIT